MKIEQSIKFNKEDICLYLFSWKRVTKNAIQLFDELTSVFPCTYFVNCDEQQTVELKIPDTRIIQLNDSYYFGGQCQVSLQHCPKNKIWASVVGDVQLNSINWFALLESALESFNKHRAGVFGPKALFHNECLSTHIIGDLHEVYNTDCTIWFVSPKVWNPYTELNLQKNNHLGWGIDEFFCNRARQLQMRAIRDDSILVTSDNKRGYDTQKALALGEKFLEYMKNQEMLITDKQKEAGEVTFIEVARENQNYQCNEPCEVAYGVGDRLVFKLIPTGTFRFNSTNFGSDPAKYKLKKGFKVKRNYRPVNKFRLIKIREENQDYTADSICEVAYGLNGQYLYKIIEKGTSITFDNKTFGEDPAVGQNKFGFLVQTEERFSTEEVHNIVVPQILEITCAKTQGLFSCFSTKLENLCDFYDKYKQLPNSIIYNNVFHYYKKSQEQSLNELLFSENVSFDSKEIDSEIQFFSIWPNRDYRSVPISSFNAFIKTYFCPSEIILKRAELIRTDYNTDYDTTIAVYYRGLDKNTETKLAPYEEFFKKARELFQKNPNSVFYVQTDELEFLKEFLIQFPNTVYNEKLDMLPRNLCKNKGVHHFLTSENANQSAIEMFASVIFMSRCKHVILSTSNISFWIVLYRQSLTNVYQWLWNSWSS